MEGTIIQNTVFPRFITIFLQDKTQNLNYCLSIKNAYKYGKGKLDKYLFAILIIFQFVETKIGFHSASYLRSWLLL